LGDIREDGRDPLPCQALGLLGASDDGRDRMAAGPQVSRQAISDATRGADDENRI
jgi:hypothetical protein